MLPAQIGECIVSRKPQADPARSSDAARPARETPLRNDVLVALSHLDECMAWRENVGLGVTATKQVVMFGQRGKPDLMGCFCSRAFAVETKVGKRGLSKWQIAWRDAFVRAGGTYIVGRSVKQVLTDLRDAVPM